MSLSPYRAQHRPTVDIGAPAAPTTKPDQGQWWTGGPGPKSDPSLQNSLTKRNVFVFILCPAMPSQVVSSNLKEGHRPNGMRGSKSL